MTRAPQELPILSSLPERGVSSGPAWLAGMRRDAVAQLREHGFPTKKTEAWRFTPVAPITSVPFEPAQPVRDDAVARVARDLGEDGTWRIVLVDGRPQLQVVGEVAPRGVRAMSLAQVFGENPALVEPYLGKLAPAEPFAALNAAMFDDGLVLQVDEGARLDRPVHLVHVTASSDAPTASYPRVLVQVGRGAELTLIETFLAGQSRQKHLTNEVSEVFLGDDAVLRHVRVHEGAESAFHVALLAVQQGRDSRYASHVFTLGGALLRFDLDVELAGEGADCTLEGAYHATGHEHVDHHTRIDHRKPNGTSREVYRGVVDGHGRAVFDGTIVVERDSQHTNAHQENRNLLLSDDAGVHTKPHLRIDADDVKCSHGATIGALDPEQLFYLRARGVGHDQAAAILTYSFLRELVDRVPHEPLRHRIGELVLRRLPHGDEAQELLP